MGGDGGHTKLQPEPENDSGPPSFMKGTVLLAYISLVLLLTWA